MSEASGARRAGEVGTERARRAVKREDSRPEPVVRAEGLHRSFPDVGGGRAAGEIHVLRGVDLEIRAGETVSIVGPSGAGKSTLLHLLGGLDRPTAGTVTLAGRDLARVDDGELARLRNRHVGFVFQFHHLLREFSALENVMMPRLVGGGARTEGEQRALELLEQVGLSERADHRPAELSGGEQQRVAVARALANEPPLLLADEPSGNLDVDTSARLHDLLFDLVDRHRSALVVVTHNRRLADRATRRLELDEGSLRERAAG